MLNHLISLAEKKTTDIVMNSEYVTSVVLTGLLVVFTALLLLVLFVYFFGKVFNKKNEETVKLNVVQLENKSIQPKIEVEEGISDEVVAVITASIAAISSEHSDGSSYAIKSIKQVKSNRMAWAFAGLQDNTKPF